MKFLNKEVDNFKEPFIVAEISCNHNGFIEKAFNLIRIAKDHGADAVKIQVYNQDSLTIPNDYLINSKTPWDGKNLYNLYADTGTPFKWVKDLFAYAKEVNIPIFSSVYDELGLEVLESVNCPAYKIASFEANDINFIRKVASRKKPIIISTGMVDDDELRYSIREISGDKIILHCVSKYPTPLKELNLHRLSELRFMFDKIPIGFSCHTHTSTAPLLAAFSGAAMIEMHLIDTAEKSPDSSFSFYPNEFGYTISMCKKVVGANKSSKEKDISLRRSLYVIRDLKKGEIISPDSLRSYRPNLGCEPYLYDRLIGKKVNQDLAKFTPMKMEYVSND